MQVVSVVSGIFFKVKINDAVKHIGANKFCSTCKEIADHSPAVIILDLEHPAALEVLQQFGKSVIAFGPHTRTDLLGIAREFGAQVYPRSIFFDRIDKILHQYE